MSAEVVFSPLHLPVPRPSQFPPDDEPNSDNEASLSRRSTVQFESIAVVPGVWRIPMGFGTDDLVDLLVPDDFRGFHVQKAIRNSDDDALPDSDSGSSDCDGSKPVCLSAPLVLEAADAGSDFPRVFISASELLGAVSRKTGCPRVFLELVDERQGIVLGHENKNGLADDVRVSSAMLNTHVFGSRDAIRRRFVTFFNSNLRVLFRGDVSCESVSTAFLRAAAFGEIHTLNYLLAHRHSLGLDTATACLSSNWSALAPLRYSRTDETALHLAVSERHEEALELLLAADAVDVNRGNFCRRTPLHYAAFRGLEGAVDALLRVPEIDVNASTECVVQGDKKLVPSPRRSRARIPALASEFSSEEGTKRARSGFIKKNWCGGPRRIQFHRSCSSSSSSSASSFRESEVPEAQCTVASALHDAITQGHGRIAHKLLRHPQTTVRSAWRSGERARNKRYFWLRRQRKPVEQNMEEQPSGKETSIQRALREVIELELEAEERRIAALEAREMAQETEELERGTEQLSPVSRRAAILEEPVVARPVTTYLMSGLTLGDMWASRCRTHNSWKTEDEEGYNSCGAEEAGEGGREEARGSDDSEMSEREEARGSDDSEMSEREEARGSGSAIKLLEYSEESPLSLSTRSSARMHSYQDYIDLETLDTLIFKVLRVPLPEAVLDELWRLHVMRGAACKHLRRTPPIRGSSMGSRAFKNPPEEPSRISFRLARWMRKKVFGSEASEEPADDPEPKRRTGSPEVDASRYCPVEQHAERQPVWKKEKTPFAVWKKEKLRSLCGKRRKNTHLTTRTD